MGYAPPLRKTSRKGGGVAGKAKPRQKPHKQLIDQRLAKAISHPVRVEILVEADRAPLSPNEYVDRRGGPLSNVAYHFRALEKLGCLEVVDEVQRRGAVEHYYAVTKRALLSDNDFAQMPAPIRGGFNASILSTFMERAQEAIEADTMDAHDNKHLTWTPIKLDKAGFDRFMAMLGDVYAAVGVEQLAAGERMAKSGEAPIHTTVALFGFESPAPERDHRVRDTRA
jgi:DNA-binding transcriptional ArsR family regulator